MSNESTESAEAKIVAEKDREAALREKALYGGHAALWRAKLGPTSRR